MLTTPGFLSNHAWQHSSATIGRADQIDGEDPVPERLLHFQKRDRPEDARAVDHYIDPPELVNNSPRRLNRRASVSNVDLLRSRVAARGNNRGRRFVH